MYQKTDLFATGEDDGNEQADDPTAAWVAPGSSDDVVKVTTKTDVKVLNTRKVLPASQWNEIQPGQILLVQNWPCKVINGGTGSIGSGNPLGGGDNTELDQADSPGFLATNPNSNPQGEILTSNTNVNVNVNVKVDVTVFVIGQARCLVQPRKNLIQRLSCSSSDQCPDSGSVCKRVRGSFGASHDSEAMDYSEPLNDAEDLGDVPNDPTEERPFSPEDASSNITNSAADMEMDPPNEDFSDWVDVSASTSTVVAVKTNVNVRVLSSRRPVQPTVWPTLPVGETLLVQNKPCEIIQNDQSDLLPDTQAGAVGSGLDGAQSDSVNVNTNVRVDVNTVLSLGTIRCKVLPPLPRPRPVQQQGWCVCDQVQRFVSFSLNESLASQFSRLRSTPYQRHSRLRFDYILSKFPVPSLFITP